MAKLVYKDKDDWVIVPPRNEFIWVVYYENKMPRYFITSKDSREFYFIYEVTGETYKRTGRAKSPLELESKYITL